MDILSELLPSREHHHARPFTHRNEQRRKLIRGAKILAVGALATAAVVEAAIQVNRIARGDAKDPNGFLNAKIEIIASDNLAVRTTPEIKDVQRDGIDNTVKWEQIEAVKSKGEKWVVIKGKDSFTIDMPAVYKPKDGDKDMWYAIDAKVNKLGPLTVEETLYINGNPQKTGEFVKQLQKGSVFDLGGNSGAEWLGTVSTEK